MLARKKLPRRERNLFNLFVFQRTVGWLTKGLGFYFIFISVSTFYPSLSSMVIPPVVETRRPF